MTFACNDCDYDTNSLRVGMTHAEETGHTLKGLGGTEGTTTTISVSYGDDEGDDW